MSDYFSEKSWRVLEQLSENLNIKNDFGLISWKTIFQKIVGNSSVNSHNIFVSASRIARAVPWILSPRFSTHGPCNLSLHFKTLGLVFYDTALASG